MGYGTGEALQEVLQGIRQALASYTTLAERAEVEEFPVVQEVGELHGRHAVELERRLEFIGYLGVAVDPSAAMGPRSIATLHANSWPVPRILSVARATETDLKRIYDGVLAEFNFYADRTSGRLLTSQRRDLDHASWRLSRVIKGAETARAALPCDKTGISAVTKQPTKGANLFKVRREDDASFASVSRSPS